MALGQIVSPGSDWQRGCGAALWNEVAVRLRGQRGWLVMLRLSLLACFSALVVPVQAQQLPAVHDLRVVATDRGHTSGIARVDLEWLHSGVPLSTYRTDGGFTVRGTTPRDRVAVLDECVDPLDPHFWVFADMPPYSDVVVTEASTGVQRQYINDGPSWGYVRDYKAFESCGRSARGGESWQARIERAVEYHVDFELLPGTMVAGPFYGAQKRGVSMATENGTLLATENVPPVRGRWSLCWRSGVAR